VLLPQMLRGYAALEKKLVLVGQGNKIEIWSDSLWQSRMNTWLSDGAGELLANGDEFTGLSV
jgi:MraZ protein